MVNTAFLLEIKSKLYIPHQSLSFFFTRAVNTAFPCTTTHTPRTVYEQTSLLTMGFFLDIPPEKHASQITEILQFHVFQRRNSERKPVKKTQDNRVDYLVPVKNIGGAHPSHPICSLRHRFKKVMGP